MNSFNSIEVIVLDFDNCLVLDQKTRKGSEEVKDQAWYRVFAEYDPQQLEKVIEAAQEQIKGGKGDRADIIRLVCQHFGVPKEKIHAIIEARCEAFNRIVQAGVLEIGVSRENRQAVKAFSEMAPVYINTATPKDKSLESLNALSLEGFADVYGRPGNKIENLEAIIAKEAVNPKKVLYIGDSESDWQAAQTIGCRFVGVQTVRNSAWNENPQEFPIVQNLLEILDLDL